MESLITSLASSSDNHSLYITVFGARCVLYLLLLDAWYLRELHNIQSGDRETTNLKAMLELGYRRRCNDNLARHT